MREGELGCLSQRPKQMEIIYGVPTRKVILFLILSCQRREKRKRLIRRVKKN